MNLSFDLSFELMSFHWFLYYEIINWELNHWNSEYYKWELNHWNSECCKWELRCWNWKSQLKCCNWNVLTFWLKRFFHLRKNHIENIKRIKKRRFNSLSNNNSFDFLWFSICFAHSTHCFVQYSVLCTLYFTFALFFQFFFISLNFLTSFFLFALLFYFHIFYFDLNFESQLTKHSNAFYNVKIWSKFYSIYFYFIFPHPFVWFYWFKFIIKSKVESSFLGI